MAHAWKACWGNTLAGSNPASSAQSCRMISCIGHGALPSRRRTGGTASKPGGAMSDADLAPSLRLRPLTTGDEESARQAHVELAAEGFEFLLDLHDGEPWTAYLDRVT